jgi:Leucine-rich repeat (LRR) protein
MKKSGKSLPQESANLWKMLTAKEAEIVVQGLHLASALPQEASILVEGVTINERTGELLRSPRFEGTRNTQSKLDALLITLLTLSPQGSAAAEIRKKVREISLAVDFFPMIDGYDSLETLNISLCKLEFQENVINLEREGFSLLSTFPKLKKLGVTVKVEGWGNYCKLVSLGSLRAPSLQELNLFADSDIGIEDISALSFCSALTSVNLSKNARLKSIEALANSAPVLQELNLAGCELIDDLAPLRGAKSLLRIDLSDCSQIQSLLPLQDSTQLTKVSLDNLNKLKSFEGLTGPKVDTFDEWKGYGDKVFKIWGLNALETLSGLPPLDQSIQSLVLHDLHALRSFQGFHESLELKTIRFGGKALRDISGLSCFKNLTTLSVSEAESLEDLSPAACMPHLKKLNLKSCQTLKNLPHTWTSPLESLELRDCDSLETLGRPPKTVNRLHIAGCKKLKKLDGLETLYELSITISSALHDESSQSCYIESAASLAAIKRLSVNYEPQTAWHGKDHDDRPRVFPPNLAAALANIPALTLTIGKERNKGFSTSLQDVSALAILTYARSIDMSSSRSVADLHWLISLPNLEYLALWPGSDVAKFAGASTFDSAQEIAKLQARLCKKYGRALPEHLKSLQAKKINRKKNTPALEDKTITPLKKLLKGDWQSVVQGIETLKALQDQQAAQVLLPELTKSIARFLSSSDANMVQHGLKIVQDFPLPEIFDELTDGVDIPNFFSGDSAAIGKIFRNVRQPDRVLARWALIWLLSLAPPEAKAAKTLREKFVFIKLEIPENWPDPQSPSLGEFKAIEKALLLGLKCKDLSLLRGLEALTKLEISNAPLLESLAGIETATELTAFSVNRCPKLLDFELLHSKSKLCTSVDGWRLSINPEQGLSNLKFLGGLRAVRWIHLRLMPQADTHFFLEAPWIKGVSLELMSWSTKLSGLHYCKSLEVAECRQNKQKSKPVNDRHVWDYDFPFLEVFQIWGGDHDLSLIRAPNLKELTISNGSLVTMEGVGNIQSLRLWDCAIQDFSGIENATISTLDLTKGAYRGLGALRKVSSLRKLLLNSEASNRYAHELQGCAQITELDIQGYSGSLRFLSDWQSLHTLDLRDSGPLTDIDVLVKLGGLRSIRIRGATVKKDSWPISLKDILVTR